MVNFFTKMFKNDSIEEKTDALEYINNSYGVAHSTPRLDTTDYYKLSESYHTNGIARKLVAKPAEDATRNGWRLVINGDEKKQKVYQQALSALNLRAAFSQEIIYQRLYGDGYITFGIDEISKTRTDIPLMADNIKNVKYVNAFSPINVVQTRVNDNPMSEDYGNESAVVVNITSNGESVDKDGNIKFEPLTTEKIVIDKSRYFHVSLDKMEDDETGNSILVRCQDQVDALDSAIKSTNEFLETYNTRAYFSSNVTNLEAGKKRKLMELFEKGLRNQSFLLAGDKDRFENISPTLSGINDLFTHSWEQLTAVSEIPKSIMIGQQAGTLAGASVDVQNYYMMVKSLQEEVIKPQLVKIVEMLMWSSDIGGISEDPTSLDWKIEFNPLYSDDNKTQAETFRIYANTLSTLVTTGIIGLDEAASMLESQDNNSVHMMQMSKNDSLEEPEYSKEELDKYKKILEDINNE
ncbi:phage portal protein [Lactobacillus sp.]|uniref:anti-CBASS protein Acb1 family protein n=1 Tax=Lactobacillus sp. TaxID=1591 RepID=UPI0019ADA0B0|nr:anti-CBASS Acb1 family protein [Lactobacillus sp.]MBD5430132.1 DUF1073 domain-containing protein [Lactobacillus sp.]